MKIVVDANVLVALVVPTPYSDAAANKLAEWIDAEAELVAPIFWSYEAVSAIRKYVAIRDLSEEAATVAVARLLAIGPFGISPTQELHLKALVWARRIQQSVAYDAAYLAMAEDLDSALWTADRKLVKSVRSLGVDWVHDIAGNR